MLRQLRPGRVREDRLTEDRRPTAENYCRNGCRRRTRRANAFCLTTAKFRANCYSGVRCGPDDRLCRDRNRLSCDLTDRRFHCARTDR